MANFLDNIKRITGFEPEDDDFEYDIDLDEDISLDDDFADFEVDDVLDDIKLDDDDIE